MPTKAPYIRGFHPQVGAFLVPTTEEGREQLGALKAGKEVMVHVHAPRNIKHHKMFFALLHKVIDGGAWDGDTDSLTDAVKIATHHVDIVIGMDGKTYYRLRSLKFESMPQDKFNRFFDRAVFYVSTRLLGNDDWEALRDEIAEIVDGEIGRQAKELAARYG
ncbi:hypothetical protein IWQ49_006418 [Labrenzia sp. EL_126]|nr:hypothetical protein [Labrenzia sp. EL_126]